MRRMDAFFLFRPMFIAGLLALGLAVSGCTKSPEALFESARKRDQSGDLAGAIVEIKSALVQQPANGPMRSMLGRLYNDTFDYVSAEKELRKAIELGAVEGGRVVRELGIALRGQGKFKETLSDVGVSQAFEPQQLAVIHTLRGRAYLIEGSMEKARQSLGEAKRLDAAAPDVQLFEAQMLVEADRTAADAIVDAVLAKHPKNFEALSYKGRLLRDAGKIPEAVEIYGRMLSLNPRHFQALVLRGSLLVRLGKLDEASKDVEAFARIYKGHPQSHILKGMWQLASKRPREALESAQLALKFQPVPENANLLAGLAFLETGSPEQAENSLTKYLADQPGSAIARRALAEAHIKRNEGRKALEVLAPLLQGSQPDAEAYTLAGEAAAASGNLARASEWYDKAAALVPNNLDLRVRKASLRLGTGKSNEGLDELAGVVEKTQSMTAADELLVIGYLMRNRIDDALVAVQKLEKRVPQNPAMENLKAVVMMSAGKNAEAREGLEKALKLAPGFFPAAANLAKLDLAAGKPEKARDRYESVLKTEPNHLAALLALSELDAVFGRVDTAIETLRKAVKAHPSIFEVKSRLATAYLATNNVDAAVLVAEEATTAHPDNPNAFVLGSNVFVRAGNVNRAIQLMSRLTQLAPSPHAYLELARVQGLGNAESDVRGSLQRALKMQKDYAPAQIALAGYLTQRGKSDEALQLARQIISDQPKSAIGHAIEGEVYEQKKDWVRALGSYRTAMKLESTGMIAAAIFRVGVRAGNANAALVELEQWADSKPGDRIAALTAATARLQVGDAKQAAARYEALLRRNAKDVDALNGMAWAYLNLNDERALRAAEAAFSLSPLSPELQDTLGWILVQKGDFKRGLGHLQAASKGLPDNIEVRYHLAYALHKSGDNAAARKELDVLSGRTGDYPYAKEVRELLVKLK